MQEITKTELEALTFPALLDEPRLTDNAIRVLEERYLAKDETGKVIETPKERFWRVADYVASAESLFYGKTLAQAQDMAVRFYNRMARGEFLPNSPTLANAGKHNGLQLSACFVLPVPDDLGGIFEAVKQGAIIHKSGGGTGYALSLLRPKGARIGSTGGQSSGPIEFLKVFDQATEAVKQGGMRRGANMAVLDVSHPDILDFIRLKRDRRIVTNFNISVGISDAFMRAVEEDREWNLFDPRDGHLVASTKARMIWDEIIESAWACGDPGLLFLDRANARRANPVPSLGPLRATNPCGEQFLYDYDACNLGSINVAAFVKPDGLDFDYERLGAAIKDGVRFLDNVIDVNPYPLVEIHERVHSLRRIGLGIMGWHHALMKLGIPYDSTDAIRVATRLMGFFQTMADEASMDLAKERGPFPLFKESIYDNGHWRPLRNACRTTVAPTGTISIIAGCSSGIEPVFALEYTHEANGRVMEFRDPVYAELCRDPRRWSELEQSGVFKTAHEIDPDWHLRHLAVFTEYVDNSVSKTINLPHAATREDVGRALWRAYELGCLNVTVFRDGCLDQQVLNKNKQDDPILQASCLSPEEQAHIGRLRDQELREQAARRAQYESEPEPEPEPAAFEDGPVERGAHRLGITITKATPVGKAHITLNTDAKGDPYEVFVNVGKAGSDVAAFSEALGRLISLGLQHGIPYAEITHQLEDIGGGTRTYVLQASSVPDAVAEAMEEAWGDKYQTFLEQSFEAGFNEGHKQGFQDGQQAAIGDLCPGCGHQMVRAEGCRTCPQCGRSDCN